MVAGQELVWVTGVRSENEADDLGWGLVVNEGAQAQDT